MRYLVTGGAGFIGSHLADALRNRGNTLALFDDLSTGNLGNIDHLLGKDGVTFNQGSIRDRDLVDGLVSEADVVVHLAASVGVQLVVQRPLEAFLNNVRGTEIVLEACAKHDRKVLVTSTSEIYGKNTKSNLKEEDDRILGSPFKTRWAYSTSKAVDEILAHTYWREKGTPSIVVRLFNTVGPRQTGAYGMVIPRLVQQALRAEDLTVYGDGTQTRCFCHVHDVVEGLIRLLEHPEAVGEVFNVGSLQEISITDLAKSVIEMADSPSRVVYIPYDEAYEEGFEDMQRRHPDISKINALTGWRPTRTLEQIIDDVIVFEKERLATPS